jgi:hypothetical protein
MAKLRVENVAQTTFVLFHYSSGEVGILGFAIICATPGVDVLHARVSYSVFTNFGLG